MTVDSVEAFRQFAGTRLATFLLLHLRTAFFEAHLLIPSKIWQFWFSKIYKVFMEPPYTFFKPYRGELDKRWVEYFFLTPIPKPPGEPGEPTHRPSYPSKRCDVTILEYMAPKFRYVAPKFKYIAPKFKYLTQNSK